MSNYSFVDMHIHTIYSDEDKCDMTIDEVLEKAQKKAERTGGADCVIAITDHNSILGVQKAREILNSTNTYSKVKLISGIEFTTDLVEMTTLFDQQRVFTRCHTLAYGFDENDKELSAYSKITHKNFSNNDNLGLQICAARRAICERFDINIPFSTLEHMSTLKKIDKFQNVFIDLIEEYFKKEAINISLESVKEEISPYISNFLTYERSAESYGRLKLSDIAKLVKHAGGELVIAHPSIIRISSAGLKYLADKEKITIKDICSQTSKHGSFSDFMHLNQPKMVFDYFIDAYEKICGYKISGIEKFYSSNFESRLDKVIDQICLERNLYQTCGSDYHGVHLHPEKTLGNVFPNRVQNLYKQQNMPLCADNAPINVGRINMVEHILKKSDQKHDTVFVVNGSVLPNDTLEDILKTRHESIKLRQLKRLENDSVPIDCSDCLKMLQTTNSNVSYLLSILEKPNESAKKILEINLEIEKYIEVLKLIKAKAINNKNFRQTKEYQNIFYYIKDIKKRLKHIIKMKPNLLKDLKKDMKYYYHKNNIYINDLLNIIILNPIKSNNKNETTEILKV